MSAILSQQRHEAGVLDLPSLRDRVSSEEWQSRVDLAACYRLVAL